MTVTDLSEHEYDFLRMAGNLMEMRPMGAAHRLRIISWYLEPEIRSIQFTLQLEAREGQSSAVGMQISYPLRPKKPLADQLVELDRYVENSIEYYSDWLKDLKNKNWEE